MRALARSILLVFLFQAPAGAQEPPPSSAKVADLVRLLQDPDVRAWLEQQPVPEPGAAAAATLSADISGWEGQVRTRIDGIAAAVPRIPAEISAAAARTRADAISRGYAPVFAIFALLVLVGVAAEAAFRAILRTRATTSAGARSFGSNALAQFVPVLVFAAAMTAVFFAFAWPPLARIALLVYLIAFTGYRVVSTLIGLTMSPGAFRNRLRLFLGILVLALANATPARPLGVQPDVREAISYLFSIILLAVALEAVWRATSRGRIQKAMLTCALAVIWLLWAVSLPGLFWIGIYALVLPDLLGAVGKLVETVAAPFPNTRQHDVWKVLVARGSRAVVVGMAVAWLAIVWRYNPNALAHRDPTIAAISYGLLKSVAVVLIADILWNLMKALIDRRLDQSAFEAGLTPPEVARRSRLRTLLPILRNALAVIALAMTGMIVLSELGVQIAPLIAGAGIFGVALGFGSQTLVKDVISGIFYMFDDAFRVGEYIQSGSYMGTVESFSLRSVRLRHHRGPVFTVPFGVLGAVQNMSRDWVIDKFKINVGYDTDLNKARKIAKAIGAQLLADPELGPLFIEPLKMKGVESFGDYGIVLGFGMTVVPGQQTYIRRKAYAMIRDAFTENGIAFAQPSVQVGGDDKAGAAAAATAIKTKAAADAATAAP